MRELSFVKALGITGLMCTLLAGGTGCEELPGSPETQGAVIGGVGGAAAGAAIGGEDNRILGAILGGAIGAGGGYIIGANTDKLDRHDSAGAQEAARRAEVNPATPQQARNAATADLNMDGFITMDEVVALDKAGMTDQEIIDKLRSTGQVFELTAQQENYLRDNGVSSEVIRAIKDLNRNPRQGTPTGRDSGVISQPDRDSDLD